MSQYCVFSECNQCAETNRAEKSLWKDYKFGHLRAIVDSEQEAQKLVEYYNRKYSIPNMEFKHWYQLWENEE